MYLYYTTISLARKTTNWLGEFVSWLGQFSAACLTFNLALVLTRLFWRIEKRTLSLNLFWIKEVYNLCQYRPITSLMILHIAKSWNLCNQSTCMPPVMSGGICLCARNTVGTSQLIIIADIEINRYCITAIIISCDGSFSKPKQFNMYSK